MTVPSEQPVTATVYGPEPDGAPTVQPVAVPVRVKSPAARPVTGSLKVTVYDRVAAFVGDAGTAVKAAVGAVRSTVTVAAVTTAAGPGLPSASVTLLAARARMTVPLEQPVTATVYGPEPDGAPTVQPVAVPVRVKSPAARPVTGSLKVTVYERVAAFVGEAGTAVKAAVGGVRSMDVAAPAVVAQVKVRSRGACPSTAVPDIAPVGSMVPVMILGL